MDPYGRSREAPPPPVQPFTFVTANHPPPDGSRFIADPAQDPDKNDTNIAFMKGPKRKRLAKACDACHKSKRRCDGTAPCSNCYFASKKCTYTDAAGNPVPAPRPARADGPTDTAQGSYVNFTDSFQAGQQSFTVPPIPQGDIMSASVDSDDDRAASRKRFRPEQGQSTESMPRALPSVSVVDRGCSERDPSLTRELVHLFFTHRQPQRMIIHKPSFSLALSRGQVPPYLLHAICAVAAPLSKRPWLQESPARNAGNIYAKEAVSLMFDSAGKLICEPSLATAQALCLLQLHDRMAKSIWVAPYHKLAVDVLESLGTFDPDYAVGIAPPISSPEFTDAFIERECARRVFWLIYISDVHACVLYGRDVSATEEQLKLRLPIDETSFEMSVHSAVQEYLSVPAPRSSYSSEIGHLIRVLSIHVTVEKTMDIFNDPKSGKHPVATLRQADAALNAWSESLPDHLQWSDDNLNIHMTMFQSDSNIGEYFRIRLSLGNPLIYGCVRRLRGQAKQRCRTAQDGGPPWARERLDKIIAALGARAKNSVILGAAMWPLFKYLNGEHPEVRTWTKEFEGVWGVKIQDLCPPAPEPLQMRPPATRLSIGHSPSIPLNNSPLQRSGSVVSSTNSIASSSSYHPVGRSPTEQRRPSKPLFVEGEGVSVGNAELREKEHGRMVSDSNIDPTLQNARVAVTTEVPRTLPSLKASGLLNWSSSPSDNSPNLPNTSWQLPSAQHLVPPRQASRDPVRSPLVSTSSPAECSTPRSSVSTRTNGMPAGMPWLANE
ncbi:fungal-specific transcription factor domain-containing protein [Hygrophoropsis aurantiaca]|uniref:Fungal-specific transcription factor domain-containing protein n=1 Tax=Hygrophoropsis aurantiaca TaxID=72124 RepID=A0ACB8AR70_9AGAM|nr:fungal-specific transcription factor domain-containing protein [Hygrophoropsis aurantiaca]